MEYNGNSNGLLIIKLGEYTTPKKLEKFRADILRQKEEGLIILPTHWKGDIIYFPPGIKTQIDIPHTSAAKKEDS